MKKNIQVTIDEHSGFCFGVINTIKRAETLLAQTRKLYCLGDIVHNNEEVQRLTDMGLVIITKDEFRQLHDTTVLIRAHGEPPETYRIAQERNIQLVDGTCPVVLALQKNIKNSFEAPDFKEGQILIFGKKGHAEVVGLAGQTNNKGIVISSIKDIELIDFQKPAKLYSQTTQNHDEYLALIDEIGKRYREAGHEDFFTHYDTICHSVVNRAKQLTHFASLFDKIIFVSGEQSSNGLYLFKLCKQANPHSYFLTHLEDLQAVPINDHDTIGICGATSTPMWLMEQVKQQLLDPLK